MSDNMSQHLVKHDYHFINYISSIPMYYFKVNGRQPHHQQLYPQWNEKFQRKHQQVWLGKPNILVAWLSHEEFSCEDRYFEISFLRQMIGEINFTTPCDSHKRKKFVKMKMSLPLRSKMLKTMFQSSWKTCQKLNYGTKSLRLQRNFSYML